MAVYYKFRSEKDCKKITIDDDYISVIEFDKRILESKRMGRNKHESNRRNFDIIVTNAHTNQEYSTEDMWIPKNTSVIIRRVPRWPFNRIVIQPPGLKVVAEAEDDVLTKSTITTVDSSALNNSEASDFDDFGDDIWATTPEVPTKQSSILMQDLITLPNEAEEDSKIEALVENSGLDWKCQAVDGSVQGRGFVKGGANGRGFGQGFGFQQNKPPGNYICHRCNIPGHFIQHCPTNGDPDFDIKKLKLSTAIPKPNEATFDEEMEGLSSTRPMMSLPPEFHCPLCKEVMKDAVFTSRCCYRSFCDKCIRDYTISKRQCFCEATDILADDLLPNTTVRDTINRFLDSGYSSTDNFWSAIVDQDMESTPCRPPKFRSPIQSPASKGEQNHPSNVAESREVKESVDGKEKIIPDVSEATSELARVKECVSQTDAPIEEIQQKLAAGDAGKKRKRVKKVSLPPNGVDMQWVGMQQQPCMKGYVGPSNFNPCWQETRPSERWSYGAFTGNMPYVNVMLPEPYRQQYFTIPQMIPHPPQRNHAEEFEAQKADVERNGGMEKQFKNMELPIDREFQGNSSGANVLSMKSKTKSPTVRRSPSPESYVMDCERNRQRKRKRSRDRYSVDYDHHFHERDGSRDRPHSSHRHQSSRSSLEPAKKRKVSAEPKPKSKSKSGESVPRHHRHRTSTPPFLARNKVTAARDYGSSDDDDRHFKRKRSTYEPTQPRELEGRRWNKHR